MEKMQSQNYRRLRVLLLMRISRTPVQKPSSQCVRQVTMLKSIRLLPPTIAIPQQMLPLLPTAKDQKKEKFEKEAESARETGVSLADLPS